MRGIHMYCFYSLSIYLDNIETNQMPKQRHNPDRCIIKGTLLLKKFFMILRKG
jgi:hypothetical protein